MEIRSNAAEILAKNCKFYNEGNDNHNNDLSVRMYAEKCAVTDSNFFRWLFSDLSIAYFKCPDEKMYLEFLASLE